MLDYLATDTAGNLEDENGDYAEFLQRVIDALGMAIAALREQEPLTQSQNSLTQWISVKDALPKRGETVLCYMNFERDSSDVTWKNTITENRYDGVLVGSNPKKHVWEWQGDYVTHWMPLPEGPEVEV